MKTIIFMKVQKFLNLNLNNVKRTFFSTISNGKKQTNYLLNVPGPAPELPGIGTSWIYLTWLGGYSKHDSITVAREDLFDQYGPVYKEKLGGATIVSLHDPQHVEKVMRNQGLIPMRTLNEANIYWRKKRPDLYQTVGLVDSTGEEWHSLRKKVSGSMLRPLSISPLVEPLSQVAEDFISMLKKMLKKNNEQHFDIKPYLFRYSLEAIWASTFGVNLGVLNEHQNEEAEQLIEHSMNLFDSFAELSLSRQWWKYFPSPTFKKFCNAEESLYRIIEKHVDKRVNEYTRDCSTEVSMLKYFLQVKDFHPKDIKTILIDFIAAGIPTTSYFLSLLLHRLGQEVKIQQKLQSEIDQNINVSLKIIDDHLLRKMKYLNAVMQEGFRLTTIIPAIMRILPQSITCSGYEIPAYTPILCQTRAACRSEKYFRDAKKFIPERWLRQDVDSDFLKLQQEARKNNFIVLPFGFGPRMCVGKRLAEKEIALLLTKIFQNFTIHSEGELELANFFIIGPKRDVKIQFIPREQNIHS